MSEAEDRKAKAARAKALVRTLLNKLKLFPFLTIRDTIAQEEATSHKVRQESSAIQDLHPVATRPPRYGFTHDPGGRNPKRTASLICLETPRPRHAHIELVHLKSRFGQTSEGDGTWLSSLSRVDDPSVSPSTTGVLERDPAPVARPPRDGPPEPSSTQNLLQSMRAELQRHRDTATSLEFERNILNKELDQRRGLETSGFKLNHLLLAFHMTNVRPN